MLRYLRYTVFCSLTLLSVFATAQDTEQLVSYETKGQTTSALLAELSRLTGLRLMASAQTENEVLYIRVNQVPLKTLLEKVSYEIGAEWERDGGGFRLVRTAHKQQLLDNEDAIKVERELRKSAKKLIDACRFEKPYTERTLADLEASLGAIRTNGRAATDEERTKMEELRAAMQAINPNHRLLCRVLPTIDLNLVAKMDLGDRMVFATQPTILQRALPSQVTQYLQTFNSESLAFQSRLGRGRRAAMSNEERAQVLSQRFSRAYLIVLRSSVNNFNVSIVATNQDSKMIVEGSTQLSFKLSDINTNGVSPFVADGPLEIDPLAKELNQILFGPNPATIKQVSDEARGVLDQPEVVEPLSILVGSHISGLLPSDSNIVIAIPDSSGQLLYDVTRSEPNPSKGLFFSKLQSDGGIAISRADGWVTGRPALWKQYSATRVSRPALRSLIDSFKAGYPTLDQLASYSVVTPMGAMLDVSFARWHGGSLSTGMLLQTRNEARFTYQVIHRMGGVQNLRQWNGKAVPVAQIAASRPTLTDWIFNSYVGPMRMPNGPANAREMTRSAVGIQVYSQALVGSDDRRNDAPTFSERTDFILNGANDRSQLLPRIMESEIIQMKNSKTGQILVMNVDSLAGIRAGFDSGIYAKNSGVDDVTQFDLYRVLKQVDVSFVLTLDAPALYTSGVVGYELTGDATYGSFGSLPETIRTRYERTYTRTMDSNLRNGAGRRGGDNGTRQP